MRQFFSLTKKTGALSASIEFTKIEIEGAFVQMINPHIVSILWVFFKLISLTVTFFSFTEM